MQAGPRPGPAGQSAAAPGALGQGDSQPGLQSGHTVSSGPGSIWPCPSDRHAAVWQHPPGMAESQDGVEQKRCSGESGFD